MFNQNSSTIVVGGPGCGKTTDLLNTVEAELLKNTPPEEIAFFSFTKKAADEGRERASKRFGLPPDSFSNFKTFHAFAFRLLNSRRDRILNHQHLDELGKLLGLEFKGRNPSNEDSVYGMNSADRMVFFEGLAKNLQVPLRKVWEDSGEDAVDWFELQRFSEALTKFKKSRGLVDFNDLLQKVSAMDPVHFPKFKLMIIDETQDLSPMQWSIAEKLASRSEKLFIGGDDRQCLYQWSGADVQRFIDFPGKQRTLEQSWRIPASVHRLAEEIADRMTAKRHQRFAPRKVEGEISWHSDVEDVDLSKGTWLLLARNGYMLDRLEDYCLNQGFSFHSINKDPLKSPSLMAMKHWENLRRGRQVCAGQVLEVFRYMTRREVSPELVKQLKAGEAMQLWDMGQLLEAGLATDHVWHEAMPKISQAERDFFLAAMKRKEELLREPRIKISTIHAAKGGEADNVLLMTEMSHRCFRNMDADPDSEHRVFYVGATRCRESLHLISPRTDLSYQL